jgi:hypothetical protein
VLEKTVNQTDRKAEQKRKFVIVNGNYSITILRDEYFLRGIEEYIRLTLNPFS